MNKIFYPLLIILAGAVQLNALPASDLSLLADNLEEGESSIKLGFGEGEQSKKTPRLVVLVTVSGLETSLFEQTLGVVKGQGFEPNGLYFSHLSHPLRTADHVASSAILHTGLLGVENGVPARTPLRKLKNGTLDRSRSIFEGQSLSSSTSLHDWSPDALTAETISECVKMETGGTGLIYSVALRAEEAITAGGNSADGAFWIDESRGDWQTSNVYPTRMPWYLDRMTSPKVRVGQGIEWTPLYSDSYKERYSDWVLGDDSLPFQHQLARLESYLTTPLALKEVTDAALALLENSGLGDDTYTDVLCLTYSLGDTSLSSEASLTPELLDGYYRLEEELDRLSAKLPKETLVAVMGDGMRLRREERGVPHKRHFYLDKCKALTNMYLDTRFGQKGLVKEVSEWGYLYLDQEKIATSKLDKSLVQEAVADFLIEFSGVSYALPEYYLRRGGILNGENPKVLAAINSVLPADRGDVYFGLQSGYSPLKNEQTPPTTSHTYYAVVSPLWIFGPGVQTSKIQTPLDMRSVPEIICETLRIRPPNR